MRCGGHPIASVEMATIVSFARCSSLSEITESDLDKVADYIETEYPKNPLKSFLGVAFTSNAWFNQHAFDKTPAKRKQYASRLLRGYGDGTPTFKEESAFTGSCTP